MIQDYQKYTEYSQLIVLLSSTKNPELVWPIYRWGKLDDYAQDLRTLHRHSRVTIHVHSSQDYQKYIEYSPDLAN